jgi:hypothetical protein
MSWGVAVEQDIGAATVYTLVIPLAAAAATTSAAAAVTTATTSAAAVIPAGIIAIRPAGGLSPALALACSATVSIVMEVVTGARQSITSSYLPGQLAKSARYALEERTIFGSIRGFVHGRVEGGGC